MTTLTDFLLARIAEDEERAEHEREFHEDWPDTPACDSCNPARVLAECEAKRRIVEWCARRVEDIDDLPVTGANIGVDVLRDLASVYAEHEDWREEWRP